MSNASFGQRFRAYAVHVYTACGVAFAFLAAAELCRSMPDARYIFGLLFAAVFVDATDGSFARRWEVKRFAAAIDGRTIDDLVDYLTYTFIPLLTMWRLGWLPAPAELFVIPALIASLFGFANTGAKDESGGFFLGFPSYWNIVAFYAGLFHGPLAQALTAAAVVAFTILTVLPVRFIYPSLAPAQWRLPVLACAVVWMLMLLAMLVVYPNAPRWLVIASLAYPLFYGWLSFRVAGKGPRERVSMAP